MKNNIDQTYATFHDKWHKNKQLAMSVTMNESSDIFNWIINRNGFKTPGELSNFLENKNRILDAGCGNGRVTALLNKYSRKDAKIVGIDLTAAKVAEENLRQFDNISFFEKDLLDDMRDLGKFDFIYCQEVLHHTKDPKKAFMNLVKLLDNKGEIAIYVYKKKSPAREYLDDFIRDKVSNLEYDDSIELMREVTDFGKSLTEMQVKVDIPEVSLLDIPKGRYDIQRLVYNFFFKCFWNAELTYEENVLINYDWYHPQLCTRHTIEEIVEWYDHAGLIITQQNVDPYGITVRGVK
jgi:SAM-dependent methyltransferase